MRFLLQFRGLHNDLRIPEFLAALSTVRNLPESRLLPSLNLIPAFNLITGTATPAQPLNGHAGSVLYGEIFYYADLASEAEAVAVARHTVLLRAIYHPIAHGPDYPACISSIPHSKQTPALAPLHDSKRKPSFRCHVDAFGHKLSVEQQLDKIHLFSDLLQQFPGPVRMKRPDYELWILEDDFPRLGHGRRRGDEAPRQVFLARKCASGEAYVRSKFSLKTRRYIGPTSMDAELSFVMATMARVTPGDFVCDPFCGTGGILVACAARGAVCVGADINIMALRGKQKGVRDIGANFAQYSLEAPVGLLRMDVLNSAVRRRDGGVFDAIVCDPPYGIKEGTRVFREDQIDEGMVDKHYQGTERVRFDEFLEGVLKFAAETLVLGGRLVYWLPTMGEFRKEDLPQNKLLRLVHQNVQPLTTRMSRRLVTMERVKEEDGVSVDADRGRMKAHLDLACRFMRQPERAEGLLRRRG